MVIDANERLAIEDDPSYRFVFAQGESLFYKTPRMDYLDDQIGDIQASIRDKEDALLRTLADQVLEEEVSRSALPMTNYKYDNIPFQF